MAPLKKAPLSQKELPTTDPSIAVPNAFGEIASLEQMVKENPTLAPGRLIALYGLRGQYLGKLDDYGHALELAGRLVKLQPEDASVALLHAGTLSTLHRFDEALAEIARAEKLGAIGESIEGARASIWQATGREEDALGVRTKFAALSPDLQRIGLEAAILGDLGRSDEAEARFIEAQGYNHDVSPFPVAWLYLQHGLMEQRLGRLATARELFQAAHERLPPYAAVTSHLASVLAVTGDKAKAVELLRGLVESSDDPEYWGQLSELLHETGEKDEAERLRALAVRRYQELVKKHPAAFADHAARFWLGAGHDPKRALALAQRNLEARKTREAHQLVLETATAAKAWPVACSTAEVATKLPHAQAALHLAAARAFEGCGKQERAAEELAAAAK